MAPNFAVPRVLEIDIHMDSKLFLNILQEIISPNSKIHIAPNIPSKKLFNALGEYGIDIYPKDVLLLIDDTTFGSATEGLILADNKFYIHPTAKKNIIIDLDAINNISCKKNKLFIDNEMVFNPSSPDAVDIAKFYTALIICIKYGVGIQSIDIKDESSQENSGDGKRKILNISGAVTIQRDATISELISSSSLDIILKAGYYMPVILVLFHYYTPDIVFSIISRMPVVGVAGFLGKIVLAPPLEKLHRAFMEFGEQYIMEKAVVNWQKQKVELNDIAEKINNIPSVIIDDKEKNEAIVLLNKYYNVQNI